MRRYPGMRLPPGVDPITRNELVKADRQLKLLSSALAKALTKTNLPTPIIGVGGSGDPGTGGLPDHDHRGPGYGGNVLGRNGFDMSGRGLWSFDNAGSTGTDKVRIVADSASQQPFSITGYSGQTADMMSVLTSAGAWLLNVSSDGRVGIGSLATGYTRLYLFTNRTVNEVPPSYGLYNAFTITENSGGTPAGAAHIAIYNSAVFSGSGDLSSGARRHVGVQSQLGLNTTDGTVFPDFDAFYSLGSRQNSGGVGTFSGFRSAYVRGGSTAATSALYHFHATNATGSSTAITVQRGFYCAALSGATTNHDFYGEGPQSYFAGLVGINKTPPTAQLDVIIGSASRIGQVIRAAGSQTASILELHDSTSAVLSLFTAAGALATRTDGTATPIFSDVTTSGRKLALVLSGAAIATSSLTVSNAAARTYTLGDDTGTLVSRTASVDLTAQTASIGSTTAYTSPHTGMYRVTIYAKTTTAGNPGDTLSVTVGWNDGTAQTFTSANLDIGTLNAYLQSSVVMYSNSAAITYATTLTSAASPQYTLRLRVEAI